MLDKINGFIDIHNHILPGIDDGAQTIEDALNLIDAARKDGTRVIVFTPHYREPYKKNTSEYLKMVFNEFKKILDSRYRDMEFYLGSEVHYEMAVPELLHSHEVMTYNDTHYALIEFRYKSAKSEILNALREVKRFGFTPVIAHLERYEICVNDKDIIDDILDQGALIQINADSVMGKQGFRIKHFCHKLLKEELVDFIASDAHNMDHRPPMLNECYKRVAKKYGEEYADLVFRDNAIRMLKGQRI